MYLRLSAKGVVGGSILVMTQVTVRVTWSKVNGGLIVGV